MDFKGRTYVPSLKWRQGEYQALYRLSPEAKKRVLPLVEIPPIEWDFEKGKLSKTIDKHLDPFAKRLKSKWGQNPSLIDLDLLDSDNRMADGTHPIDYVFDGVRREGVTSIPVTGITRTQPYQDAIRRVVGTDKQGVGVRVKLDQLASPDTPGRLQALLSYLEVSPKDTDLIIDLGAPAFDPISTFANVIKGAVAKLLIVDDVRMFCVTATAFPDTMGKLAKGTQFVPRSEWLLYKAYLSLLKGHERNPIFGDYGIAHPVLPALDMRLIKPAASIRYAVDDAWLVVKGENVRDHGFKQYVKLCQMVTTSGHFSGEDYSEADAHILNCSKGAASTGNLSTWRWIGTNHHITKVADDTANFVAPS